MMRFSQQNPISDYLANLTADAIIEDVVSVKNIVKNSLYYPCCGFDGRPVRYFAKSIQNFIYVDYGYSRNGLVQELTSENGGFRGYKVLAQRDVSEHELVPKGWGPTVLPNSNELPPERHSVETPFCLWLVFQRLEKFGETHGPERFSLLYLCADGAVAYQALFRKYTPKAIAIIQPGTGFGGNYTDYCDPDGLFARSVRANGNAMPEFILNGGIGGRKYYKEPIWLESYDVDLGWVSDQSIHVWGASA